MAKPKRSRAAKETVDVRQDLPPDFGDAEFREMHRGKVWRVVGVRPVSSLLQRLAAQTWHDVTGGKGVTLVDGKPVDPKGGS